MKRFWWLGLLVGLMLFYGVLRSCDLAAVWQQVRGLQWRFGLILLFYGVIFGLDTLGWRFTLTPWAQSRVRWDRLFRARLAGEAVNYVTPTAWIGGEPVKAVLLFRRYGVPLADGMASVVVAKTTFSFSMFLFIVMGILVTLLTQPVNALLLRWVWIALSGLGVLLGLFLAAQFLKPFGRAASLMFPSREVPPSGGASMVNQVVPGWLRLIGSKVQEWDQRIVQFYRQSPKALFLSIGFHFLGWMAGIVEVYLILYFLKIPVSLATAWSIEALWILLKSGAFLIPASLGASEGFLIFVCLGLGINAVSALALGLVRRARELTWMGLGLVEFVRG